MGYLVIKGNRRHAPENGDIVSIMRSSGSRPSKWVTRQRGAHAELGDRCLLWSSSPDRAFVGAAELVDWDEQGDSCYFWLKFVSKAFPKPWLGAEELRQQDALKDSVFLKSGPAFTIFHISPREAHTILALLRQRYSANALGGAAQWHETPMTLSRRT